MKQMSLHDTPRHMPNHSWKKIKQENFAIGIHNQAIKVRSTFLVRCMDTMQF